MQIDVYPKYSGAVQDRPVSIRAMITIGEEDLPILEAIGYGLEATLPQRMISSVTIDLPAGLGGIFSGRELNIGPATTEMDEPLTLALRIMAEDKLVASYPVYLKERTGGPRGFVLTGTDSTGWLAMRLTVNAVDEDADAELRVIPQSGLPTALVPLFQWLDAFQPIPAALHSLAGGFSSSKARSVDLSGQREALLDSLRRSHTCRNVSASTKTCFFRLATRKHEK